MKDRYNKLISLGALYHTFKYMANETENYFYWRDLQDLAEIEGGRAEILGPANLVDWWIRYNAHQDLVDNWYDIPAIEDEA